MIPLLLAFTLYSAEPEQSTVLLTVHGPLTSSRVHNCHIDHANRLVKLAGNVVAVIERGCQVVWYFRNWSLNK